MNSSAHYFRIGLFFIAAVLILVAGLFLVSADILTADSFLIETYIDESVQGLAVGSPLFHRGVTVGRVKKITFASREYPMASGSAEFEKFSRYVMVIMTVDKKNFIGPEKTIEEIKTLIRNQIRSGLRLKLSYQGITGIAYLEADYIDPVRNPPLVPPWQTKNIYVPSTTSLITSFTQAVDSVFQRLEKIDFPAVFAQLESTLKAMQTAMDEAQIPQIRQTAIELMAQLNKTAQQADILMQSADPNLPQTSLPDTMAQFNRNLRQIENLIAGNEDNIDKILYDLRSTIRNLKGLSEQLKADPAQLLLSQPPARLETTK